MDPDKEFKARNIDILINEFHNNISIAIRHHMYISVMSVFVTHRNLNQIRFIKE